MVRAVWVVSAAALLGTMAAWAGEPSVAPGGEAPAEGRRSMAVPSRQTPVRGGWSPHDMAWGQPPIVTCLSISADGQRVAAAYYVPAMNRPGTDWDAWVATWDLKTGRRTILHDACGPVAVSPDGKLLAARRFTAGGRHGYTTDPPGELALWEFGAEKPARAMGRPAPTSEPATLPEWHSSKALTKEPTPAELSQRMIQAVTFAEDGRSVLGLAGDGRIFSWPAGGDAAGAGVGRVAVEGCLFGGYESYRPPYALERTAWGLLAMLPTRPAPTRPQKGTSPYAVAAELRWSVPKHDQLNLSHVYTFASDPSRTNAQAVMQSLSRSAAALPAPAVPFQYLSAGASRDPVRWVAASLMGECIAVTDGGMVVVRTSRGEEVARFPGCGPVRFTPDGRRLIAATRNGVLRFWDVQSGTIARTLRLDDQPAETFRVAAVQCPSVFGEPEKNREALGRCVAEAAGRGADVVVLPEAAVTGYMSPDLRRTWQTGGRPTTAGLTGVDPKDAAETVPGPSTRFFAALARKHGIHLTVPLLEADRRTGRYFNTVVLLGPDGALLTHYRKIDPWPWAERSWATSGDLGRPVADTPFGRFGTLICFDIHRQAAEMSKLKIDTLLYSIAWVDEEDSDWFPVRLPAIAARHQFNIVGANWTVPYRKDGEPAPDWSGYGHSCVISAAGKTLAKARDEEKEETVFADLPLLDRKEGGK